MKEIVEAVEIAPCKICGAPAPLFGAVDFNKNCAEDRGHVLPALGIAISYRRCSRCEFLFTNAFDRWTPEDFSEHIYNDAYIHVDPDYARARPENNAGLISKTFAASKANLSVLDYGGGGGLLAERLREAGFARADSYDPFSATHSTLPTQLYDIVSCFEVLEHHPDPIAGIETLVRFVREPGIVIFSTLLQEAGLPVDGMNWWYIGPRNGHISIFSRPALVAAWARFGYTTGSVDYDLHVAFKTVPEFARSMFSKV